MVSIIVPLYNEERMLRDSSSYFAMIARESELIFVDGGSCDRSIEVALSYGKVTECQRGRAFQMNCGAGIARHEILLFLHADTYIAPETLASIEKNVGDGLIGGCLMQKIDDCSLIYRIIEEQGNIRARLSKVFYGDQGIFVRKDIFLKLGGFPAVPIFEDVLFTKKLRQTGETAVLPDRIFVSPRRWQGKGLLKTIALYNMMLILFKLGFSLEKIQCLYDDVR